MQGHEVDDCLQLLIYVSKHRGDPQTVRGLSRATGIPKKSLELYLREAQACQTQNCDSLLHLVAMEQGYDFWVFHHGHEIWGDRTGMADRRKKVEYYNLKGTIIDAVRIGPYHYRP